MGDETRRLINALMTCIRDNGEFKGRAELLIWGSSVLSGPPHTITLPRAEVEALMEAVNAFQMIRAVWTDPHNDDLMREASMTLDTLQERMK